MLPLAGPLDGLQAAFDGGASTFALATPDGRVRTFDTVTGRLRSTLSSGGGVKGVSGLPNGHLADSQRCLAWVEPEEGSAKARSGNPAGPSRACLAVGTASGSVQLFDGATGELRWQAAGCNEGGVDCLAAGPGRRGQLFSSGRQDGQVVSLDVATGKKLGSFRGSKHGLAAAALSQDGARLLLGGSTMSLWDVESQQRAMKFTGHQLVARVVAFAPSGAFALSAGEDERLVAVWATSAARQGKKRSSGTVATLAVEQPAVALTTAAAEAEGEGCFYAAATTQAGEAYVWLLRPEGEAGVHAQQIGRAHV